MDHVDTRLDSLLDRRTEMNWIFGIIGFVLGAIAMYVFVFVYAFRGP